jgi:hypothetical protein
LVYQNFSLSKSGPLKKLSSKKIFLQKVISSKSRPLKKRFPQKFSKNSKKTSEKSKKSKNLSQIAQIYAQKLRKGGHSLSISKMISEKVTKFPFSHKLSDFPLKTQV